MDRRLRLDLTDQLTYLFKPAQGDLEQLYVEALETASIAGTKPDYVMGDTPVIGLTETPLTIVAKLLASAAQFKVSFAPIGFLCDRKWAFAQGARPVIYQPAKDATALAPEQRYRHVTLDLEQGIDFTWKREWRLPRARLALEPAFVRPLLPTQAKLEQARAHVAPAGAGAKLLSRAVVLEALG
jgi:hypothetical protein